MSFAQPLWLILLGLLPVLIYGYRRGTASRHVALQMSRQVALRDGRTWVVYARRWIQGVRWLVLALLMVAMARPQRTWQEEEIDAEAVDIMLTMDISPSMLSKDLPPDRLSVAKQVAINFVSRRKYDRLGLVVFADGAFAQCPLTADRRILQAFINNLQSGRLADGTAIGTGIATAVHHLKDSPSKSKVVLLLTDGEQNAGQIHPLQAADMARALGVRVYVIGLGADGTVLSPVDQRFDGSYVFAPRSMVLDTRLLEETAQAGGGKYYRARSAADLQQVYNEIDALEKTKVTTSVVVRVQELFFWFLAIAFCLLVLEMLLRWGPLRVITV